MGSCTSYQCHETLGVVVVQGATAVVGHFDGHIVNLRYKVLMALSHDCSSDYSCSQVRLTAAQADWQAQLEPSFYTGPTR